MRLFRLSISFPTLFLITFSLALNAHAEDWPQWRGVNRDGEWHETGLMTEFPSKELTPRWRQKIGAGYSGPTVANGRVFVTDRIDEPKQIERVLCFDFETGKELWKHEYPCDYGPISYRAGPRACVTIEGERAYALGALGNLHCLAVETGEVLWKRDLNVDYKIIANRRMPIWGIAAAPLVVDDIVILHIGGSDGACVVGLNKTTGAEVWRSLKDRASYSAPILIEQSGKQVAVVWTGDSVAGLNPKTGDIYWRRPFSASKMPIGIATPIVDKEKLYVTSFYDGSLMLNLDDKKTAVSDSWQARGRSERSTEALHSIISTPLMRGGFIYGVDSYGELRCLEASTGKRIWEDLTATPRSRWSTIHFVQNGDTTWMLNERGELIIAKLSASGFREFSRAKIIEPTEEQLRQRGGVCWSHPAFANKHIIARNDNEIVCTSLEEPKEK